MTRIDVIANERLIDDRQQLHEIQDYWAKGPLALIFLRQFGSAFAVSQARAFNRHYDEIRDLGADLVFVGLGNSMEGYVFRERTATRYPVLTTHDRALHRTMGLWRDAREPLRPTNLVPLLRVMATERVYPYGRTGDNAQLGGAFVATRGGQRVVYSHRAARIHQTAPVDEVLRALTEASTVRVESR
ncbi:redoxin domain-containing protein [Gordonia sp. X0973]|uniref:peroxiredoxin-like family protein n=1 Tax=Gordonia sp. X0973 TaxID=2742602 RepID=UPI000F52FB68|nr:peroxiredoxin-like family protein [Gordonia sp. X0973]QKT08200.1 redoxin domain-containing protein [Gordonia sp. X0973]